MQASTEAELGEEDREATSLCWHSVAHHILSGLHGCIWRLELGEECVHVVP